MISATAPVCPDWVFANNANVHVSKDRAWFKTYTPFESTNSGSGPLSGDIKLQVIGTGTVEIPTKRSPNLTGASSHGSIHLKEVLHVPDFICNIIGYPIFADGYDIEIRSSAKSKGSISDSNGKKMAYFNPDRKFFTLKVRGPPTGPKLGPCPFQKDQIYMIGCQWDAGEQRKWREFKKNNSIPGSSSAANETPPYTAEEKMFMKENWGDEYHFLLEFGLKIHDEEDRAEGRSILRMFRREDALEDDSDDWEDHDEWNPEGHQADYNFSARQLEWIEQNYENSEEFMLSYGLKFYNDDDVEEAKALAEAFLTEDQSVVI